MVRYYNRDFTEKENELFSSIASVARLEEGNFFYRSIGRYQKSKAHAYADKFVKLVKARAKRLKSEGLKALADEGAAIIKKHS